ncbi:MAG: hypothetical protein ACYTHK_09595 [Planctomycetota bacterium]|jgi:hypothetical protein
MRRRLALLGLKILLLVTVTGVTLEVALRIVPGVIPTRALLFMEPDIRQRVAKGRFSTTTEMVPVERDDGGPILRVWKPGAFKRYPWLKDHGAVQEVQVDAQGFSNPPGRYLDRIDIIAIGDSFTFAHAIDPEDAWAVRLGPLVGKTSYGLGLAGNGLHEYIQLLKAFGLSRKPGTVVMNVYEGNDLRDAAAYRRAAAGQGEMDELAAEPWHGSFLGRHSYAYNLIRGYTAYLVDRSERKAEEEAIDFRFAVKGIAFNAQQGALDEPAYAIAQQEGRYGFDLFDKPLEDFKALADEHGFRPLVTYTPWAHAVYAPVTWSDPELPKTLEAFSREQRAYLRKKCAELGIEFLDLEPALRAAVSEPNVENLLYYPTTIHFTARGHEVVAAAIAEKLR